MSTIDCQAPSYDACLQFIAGKSQEDAKTEYIKLVEELKAKYA